MSMIRATRTPNAEQRSADERSDATLGARLEEAAASVPDRLAVVQDGFRLTFAELYERTVRLTSSLRELGVGRGDVVSFQLPNWWECLVVFHAVQRLGAIANPIVAIYREAEVSFILDQARPKAFIVPEAFRGHDFLAMIAAIERTGGYVPQVVVVRGVTPPVRPEGHIRFEDLIADADPIDGSRDLAHGPDDVALLIYTSGTVAEPKGVLHSHRTLLHECASIVDLFGLESKHTVFMPSPLTHITGVLYGCLMPQLVMSASTALLDIWSPERGREVVDTEQCRFTVGATPFLQGLVDEYSARPAPSCALDYFICGGADVPPELVRSASSVLDACVARVYGSSEFPTFSSGTPSDPLHRRAETDGRPIGLATGRLIDEVDGVGELIVSGKEMFLGYANPRLNDGSFTADGYFRTGDLASIDEDGFVTIRGRKKDIIIRGGENISAKEVEDHLYELPAIRECAVVAMPDPVLGEKCCAVVIAMSDDHSELTTEGLSAHLKNRGVARQKHPERVIVVDELPKTASGKVQKFRLREMVVEILASEKSGGEHG